MKVLAHRGNHHDALENSLQAFKAINQTSANGVELDIRLSKDGTVLVFHDEDLKRLFDKEMKIADLTIGQINEISAQKNVIVPALKEVFDLLLPESIINVEIKEPEVVFPLIDLLRENDYPLENLIFSSFIHNTLPPIRDALKGARIGLLIGSDAENVANPMGYIQSAMLKHEPYSLHLPIQAFEKIEQNLLVNALTDMKEKTQIQYAWWTVNTIRELSPLVEFPNISDYIITDNPEQIINHIKSGG
ncbi:MAG: glycerophosphodiester phosphodiesterase family protein [Thermotogota bacterium]|nr:glycerophosphodiester phosphodiesterase family protein [Thermotogota bacterium]